MIDPDSIILTDTDLSMDSIQITPRNQAGHNSKYNNNNKNLPV
jgi:hypothetical protein